MMAAAAAGRPGGSPELALASAPGRRLLLLLPLLLRPPRPALGNEGGGVGSCMCERFAAEPPIVRLFPDRLVAWENCRDLVRFVFPQKCICGLANTDWVIQFKTLHAKKEKARAGKRCHKPTGTSQAPLLPPSSGSPAQETPEPQQALTSGPAARKIVGGVPQSQNGMGAGQGPPEAALAPGRQVAVLCLLGITLFLVAVTVSLVCWRKFPGRPRVTLIPQNDPATDPEESGMRGPLPAGQRQPFGQAGRT